MEEGSTVVIDASNSKVIDRDVIEVIEDFKINAKRRNIRVEVAGFKLDEAHQTSDSSSRTVAFETDQIK